MIKYKIIVLLTLIFIFLSINAVNADELSDNTSNFTQLTQEINETNDKLLLTNNYTAYSSEDKVFINKSLEVDGNNFTIDFKNFTEIFEITNDSNGVVFKNIIFKNLRNDSFIFAENSNISFINCNFNNELNITKITLVNQSNLNKTSKISYKIKKLAKKIVGKSKGTKALKKIAKWVSKRIAHEKRAGFYQSPLKTLKRKKGNCCCHSELFFQLCASLGYTKKYKIYIIHVGTMKVKRRHFFNIVNNYCVDTYKTKSWGHSGFGSRSLYSITKYPYLPLIKAY